MAHINNILTFYYNWEAIIIMIGIVIIIVIILYLCIKSGNKSAPSHLNNKNIKTYGVDDEVSLGIIQKSYKKNEEFGEGKSFGDLEYNSKDQNKIVKKRKSKKARNLERQAQIKKWKKEKQLQKAQLNNSFISCEDVDLKYEDCLRIVKILIEVFQEKSIGFNVKLENNTDYPRLSVDLYDIDCANTIYIEVSPRNRNPVFTVKIIKPIYSKTSTKIPMVVDKMQKYFYQIIVNQHFMESYFDSVDKSLGYIALSEIFLWEVKRHGDFFYGEDLYRAIYNVINNIISEYNLAYGLAKYECKI